jgi:hypothetical protein
MPNEEGGFPVRVPMRWQLSSFGIRHSFVIRHSSFVIYTVHSGEGEPALADQASRRCLAWSKNFEMARSSQRSNARLNSPSPSAKADRARSKFARLAIAMSRHISGEPAAMRVVSRKPLAQSIPCSFG